MLARAPTPAGPPLRVKRGVDVSSDLVDVHGSARESYGMRSSGIVLVRPDGYVGLFGDTRDVDGYLQLVGFA